MKRRNFLGRTGLVGTSIYFSAMSQLMDVILRNNMAKASGKAESAARFVNIQFTGGPPQWYFSQPLSPFDNGDDVVLPGNFGTALKKVGTSARPILVGKKINFGGQEVFLPPVWDLKSAGTGIEFKSLLENSMMIRGIDMQINSHIVNRMRPLRPVPSYPSITGQVADRSDLPVAATGSSGSWSTRTYKSRSGASVTQANVGNPIPSLIDAFKHDVSTPDELELTTTQVLDALDRYASHHRFSTKGAEKQQTASYSMFARHLNGFQADWNQLRDKYLAIISKELRAVFPDITDVGDTSDGSNFYQTQSGLFLAGTFGETMSRANLNLTAHAFAFVEFVLTRNISSSVTVDIPGLTMATLENFIDKDGKIAAASNISTDQHTTGAVASVYYTSLYYRGILGCLTSLKQALETADIFKDTLIQFSSEFSRTAKADNSGSDHGFLGASTLLFGGMIKTPGLIGNISKEPKNPRTRVSHPGTYGEASVFFRDEGRPIQNDDVVATVCNMLNIPNVGVKGRPLAINSGGDVSWTQQWEIKNE